jgi:hypothetical protein
MQIAGSNFFIRILTGIFHFFAFSVLRDRFFFSANFYPDVDQGLKGIFRGPLMTSQGMTPRDVGKGPKSLGRFQVQLTFPNRLLFFIGFASKVGHISVSTVQYIIHFSAQKDTKEHRDCIFLKDH